MEITIKTSDGYKGREHCGASFREIVRQLRSMDCTALNVEHYMESVKQRYFAMHGKDLIDTSSSAAFIFSLRNAGELESIKIKNLSFKRRK